MIACWMSSRGEAPLAKPKPIMPVQRLWGPFPLPLGSTFWGQVGTCSKVTRSAGAQASGGGNGLDMDNGTNKEESRGYKEEGRISSKFRNAANPHLLPANLEGRQESNERFYLRRKALRSSDCSMF